MSSHPGLRIHKPSSVLFRNLDISTKSILRRIGSALLHGATGNWAGIAEDVLDISGAFNFREDPGAAGWCLINEALLQSLRDLVEDNSDIKHDKISEEKLEQVCSELADYIEKLEIFIDRDFLSHPQNHSLISDIKPRIDNWLRGFGIQQEHCFSMVNRLPAKFATTLYEQGIKNPQKYEILVKALDVPVADAAMDVRRWDQYSAQLRENVEARLFGEVFTLNDVYISLRGYYKENATALPPQPVVNVEASLSHWVEGFDASDVIRVISGGPGSGKSSLVKKFAANMTRKNIRVLYIPMHLFDPRLGLGEAIDRFLVNYTCLGELAVKPLSPKHEGRLLLVFDGVDELSLSGRAGPDIAGEFLHELVLNINDFNRTKSLNQQRQLQLLITGRSMIIEANQKLFTNTKQVIHLFPYFVDEKSRPLYRDDNNLLGRDQRNDWWALYGEATGNPRAAMPTLLRSSKFDEITSQPLLNYLLTFLSNDEESEFADLAEMNLNAIYAAMLKNVYEGGWGRNTIRMDLAEEQFYQILEEFALAVWQGNGRTCTENEIRKRCEVGGVKPYLDEFEKGARDGVIRLLMAFYFHYATENAQHEKTFEFTHKSFGEYLAARRMVRILKHIHQDLERNDQDPFQGNNETVALEKWLTLFGPAALDEDLYRFVLNEIALHQSSVLGWKNTLKRLLTTVLKNGMPAECLRLGSYKAAVNYVRNAEEALLVLLYACADCTKTHTWIDKGVANNAFGDMVHRIRGQRDSTDTCLALQCLGWLQLCDWNLQRQDFYAGNFQFSDFTNAQLAGTIFGVGANLENTAFKKANLNMVNFCESKLGNANLQEANLRNANLEGADLRGADLSNAKLDNANLRGVLAQGANFTDCCLGGADLRNADLTDADFSDADLTGANLENVIGRGD